MEMCIFAITYFLTTVINILDFNIIIHIGVAILLVAILVYNQKIVLKIVFLAITLSTIMFNFHEKTEKEYEFLKEIKNFTAVAIENEQRYENYSAIVANVEIEGVSFKSKIYFVNQGQLLRPDDEISGVAYVYQPSYSSGFDREIYYKSNGINVLISASDTKIKYNNSMGILRISNDIRYAIEQKLDEKFDFDTSSFVKALVLGDKSDFDYEFEADVSKAGISHILAVSGMHVGFLASLCMLVFGKRNGGIFAGIFVTMFLFIVGPSPSILRAVIMQYMIIIAWFIKRENSSKVSVWVAFVLLIMFEPYVMFDVGFILSFMSAISIIYLYEPVYNAIKCKNEFINKFIYSSLAISVAVTGTTTFALFYYFGYISTVMVISNILIIPIVAVLFPLCIIYIFAILLPSGILFPFTKIIQFLVLIIREIIQYIAKFKYAIVDINLLQLVVLFVLIAICVVCFKFNKCKKIAILSSLVIFTATGIYASYANYNQFKITVFSVGDGQCILVTYKDEVNLIDCASNEYYTASSLVNSYMYKYAYDNIDNLIITSIDNTHLSDISSLNHMVNNVVYPEKYVREEANEILVDFISERKVTENASLPDYIKIYDAVEQKLAVLVNDTLILHGFTNLMLEKFIDEYDITAKTVVLADKTIGEYRRLESVLNELGIENVILSNDYDMLSRVSGFPAKTTAEYGNITIK